MFVVSWPFEAAKQQASFLLPSRAPWESYILFLVIQKRGKFVPMIGSFWVIFKVSFCSFSCLLFLFPTKALPRQQTQRSQPSFQCDGVQSGAVAVGNSRYSTLCICASLYPWLENWTVCLDREEVLTFILGGFFVSTDHRGSHSILL